MNASARSILTGLVLLSIIAYAASPASALGPHDRKSWMVGIGLGLAASDLVLISPTDNEVFLDTDWESGIGAQYRIGKMIGQHFMVSFENKQWIDEQGVPEIDEIIKLRANVQHFGLGLTWFPGNLDSPAGGLFLKAGAGIGNARFTVLRPTTEQEKEDSGGSTFKELAESDDNGLALFGEFGYELRVFPSLGAGLAVSYTHYDIDEPELYQSAQTVATVLSLNWYF